jgi:signal transduction histidine kinase
LRTGSEGIAIPIDGESTLASSCDAVDRALLPRLGTAAATNAVARSSSKRADLARRRAARLVWVAMGPIRFPGESPEARRARALRGRVGDLQDARQRVIATADAERRRIERDLHDGAQQRLVSVALTLSLAEAQVATGAPHATQLIAQAREEIQLAIKELRELARGIHPAVLSDHGLKVALEALAARAPVPVEVSGVPAERLQPEVESAAYFVTAEALTNMAKYARASEAKVRLSRERECLRVLVRDNGVGGADPSTGSGLRGLCDRVDALDGRLEVESPPGGGTTVTVEIPLRDR